MIHKDAKSVAQNGRALTPRTGAYWLLVLDLLRGPRSGALRVAAWAASSSASIAAPLAVAPAVAPAVGSAAPPGAGPLLNCIESLFVFWSKVMLTLPSLTFLIIPGWKISELAGSSTAAALAHSMALKGAWCCSKPAGCGTRWWRKADAIGQRVRRKPPPRGSNACCVRRMLCSDCVMGIWVGGGGFGLLWVALTPDIAQPSGSLDAVYDDCARLWVAVQASVSEAAKVGGALVDRSISHTQLSACEQLDAALLSAAATAGGGGRRQEAGGRGRRQLHKERSMARTQLLGQPCHPKAKRNILVAVSLAKVGGSVCRPRKGVDSRSGAYGGDEAAREHLQRAEREWKRRREAALAALARTIGTYAAPPLPAAHSEDRGVVAGVCEATEDEVRHRRSRRQLSQQVGHMQVGVVVNLGDVCKVRGANGGCLPPRENLVHAEDALVGRVEPNNVRCVQFREAALREAASAEHVASDESAADFWIQLPRTADGLPTSGAAAVW